jgi:hypothetical protein
MFGTHSFGETGFSFFSLVTPSYNGEQFNFTIYIQQILPKTAVVGTSQSSTAQIQQEEAKTLYLIKDVKA